MNRSMLIGALALGWLLSGSLSSAFALPFSVSLNVTNSFSVDLEPAPTLSVPIGEDVILGIGVEFAIGNSSSAVFPGITQIGQGSLLDGNTPVDLWIPFHLPFE